MNPPTKLICSKIWGCATTKLGRIFDNQWLEPNIFLWALNLNLKEVPVKHMGIPSLIIIKTIGKCVESDSAFEVPTNMSNIFQLSTYQLL